MKTIFITITCLFTLISAYSQKVIEKPKIGYTTAPEVKIEKIELRDTATIISFKTFSNGFFIPDKTYIQPFGEKDKLFIKGTNGIKMWTTTNPGPSGFTEYKLIFPPINNSVQKLDYGEQGGGWFIYDIQLKPLQQTASVIPQDLLGNWLNISTGELAVSFYDTVAVYKSKPWSYSNVNLKKGKGSIVINNKGNATELFVNLDKKGLCKIGEKQDNLINCSKNPKQIVKDANGEKLYELPVFKIDSATYSGYFKGYSIRIGGKTLSVYVNDIIVGNQNTFVAEISGNGFFSIKVPIYYPGEVYVRSQFYNGSVYLEPGKNLFQVIDPEDTESASLFMGESAGINSDLQRLQSINRFNYSEMQSKILDMKAVDYKAYYQNLQQKYMKALDSMMQIHTISAKAYQVKKLELDYRYFYSLMEYDSYFESVYRDKYKIPYEQKLPVKIDTITAEYLNCITNENSNNPLAVVSPSYYIYINRLKYLDMLRPKNISIDLYGLAEELEKSGYVLTESEKKLISTKNEQKGIDAERKALQDKYKSVIEEFQNKYGQIIQDLHKSHKNTLTVDTIIKYIENKGMQLTSDEKEFLKKSDELSKRASKAYNPDSANAFYNRHNDFLNKVFSEKRKSARNENLEKLLGVKKGFVTDIMDAQDICRSISEEYAVLSDNDLKAVQSQISTPFISDYIANCNNQAKLRIEANKLKKGYVVNSVPKTEADKLFDSIMVKYKGKVVYVDFWATWCGPCRSGIQEIAPLKEEMAGENVVFVYITGPSSPEGTYLNMIPNIKGEHYRVSSDEWNYLCGKFNISGIPHYTLVGKDGRVINSNLNHMGNDGIKAELKKWINE